MNLKSLAKNGIITFTPDLLLGWVYSILSCSFFKKVHFKRRNCGENVFIHPTAQLIGLNNISIGSNSLISEGCWFNVNFRSTNDIGISIGNNCHIGRRNFFSSGPLISIGDYSFTSVDCHFLGCGHSFNDPRTPYNLAGLTKGGKIRIGVNCWLATSVTVLEGVSIGHGSIVGARSLVVSDVPPFSLVIGSPARVIKRFDFERKEWVSAEIFSLEMERMIPNESDYLIELSENFGPITNSIIASGSDFGAI